MKTFQIAAPLSSHRRPATCEEVQCANAENGWKMRINEGDPQLGAKQAHYIRKMSGRKFTEHKLPGGLTEFVFSSGQPCFAEHTTRLERQELYVVRDSGLGGRPGRSRRHTKPEFWIEELSENQDRLSKIIEKG